ncbi:hypothetical protein ACP70R_040731 [Stipagrostis hirtigluma subsp. patula]
MLQELPPCTCGGRLLYSAAGCRCGGAAASSAFPTLFAVEAGGSPCAVGAVDCTLSLGTPSTRRAAAATAAASCGKESGRGWPPADRRCANCDTTSTPLWRNGPRGPKSLCNACGIRYKKEERRAAAAVAPAPADSAAVGYACGGYARQQHQQPQWGCYGAAAAKSASFGMYPGDVVDAAADGPCLPWMLNVMPASPAFAVRDRHTLFQYY